MRARKMLICQRICYLVTEYSLARGTRVSLSWHVLSEFSLRFASARPSPILNLSSFIGRRVSVHIL